MSNPSEFPYPLEFSRADIYHIYPFVFDFQSIAATLRDSPLERWVENRHNLTANINPKWCMGLPETRLGYPPVLPYKALVEHLAHAEWSGNDLEIKLKSLDGGGEETLPSTEKTLTIRECGAGTLTYKFTIPEPNQDKDIATQLEDIIKLVPRIGDKLDVEGVPEDDQPSNKPSLFEDVKTTLGTLDKDLKTFFEHEVLKAGIESLWEDKEVLLIDRASALPSKSWVVLPFTFTVLYLTKEQWNKFEAKLPDPWINDKRRYIPKPLSDPSVIQFIMALAHQYYGITENRYSDSLKAQPETLAKIDIDTPSYSRFIKCYMTPRSLLAILFGEEPPDSTTVNNVDEFKIWFNTKRNVPVIINTLEAFIAKVHFALILDALLDKLLIEITHKGDTDYIKVIQKKFYRLQLQAALFLEDIAQHVETGYLGFEITQKLRDRLRVSEFEKKIQEKLGMTERVLLGKQLDIDDAICGLNRPAE